MREVTRFSSRDMVACSRIVRALGAGARIAEEALGASAAPA
jgi:hypothetical protein